MESPTRLRPDEANFMADTNLGSRGSSEHALGHGSPSASASGSVGLRDFATGTPQAAINIESRHYKTNGIRPAGSMR